MLVSDLSAISGLCRQWLNKLVDRDGISGVRRKENGRLEIFDESAATEWAASVTSKPAKVVYSAEAVALRPIIKWIVRGRTDGSVKARAEAIGWTGTMGFGEDVRTFADIARKNGISRQALSAALKTSPLPPRILAARKGRPIKSSLPKTSPSRRKSGVASRL
jgi:membrane-bound lytic murein transglycosylase B